jgi:hypothetical protein
MNLIEALQQAVLETLVGLFESILLWIPNFLGAFVIILLGLLFAKVGRDIVELFFEKIQLDRWLTRFHINDVIKEAGIEFTVSGTAAFIIYWAILLAFIQSAVGLLGVVFVTRFIDGVFAAIPDVVAAAAVLLIGITLAQYTSRGMRRVTTWEWAPRAAKGFVILLAALIAIGQLGVNVDFIARLITNVITAATVALAIAFGFGGKDKAKELIDKYLK